MEPSKEEWLEALVKTMERWREAQSVAQGDKDTLEEYLDATDCPLCNLAFHICANCIVSKILGVGCHGITSYIKLRASCRVEAVNAAIRLMLIDMNAICDKLEGGGTDEKVDNTKIEYRE